MDAVEASMRKRQMEIISEAAINCAKAVESARLDERERCANIALAIDSGRGNEKEIAVAIRRGD